MSIFHRRKDPYDRPPRPRSSVWDIFRGIKALLSTLLILAVIFAVLYFSNVFGNLFQSNTSMITETIAKLKENVSELSTVKYHYTDVGSFENHSTISGFRIPLTTKRFIISYDGIITLGIKLDKVKFEVKDKVIEISLPPAELLSHELDERSLKVFDEQSGLFNAIKISDYADFVKVKKPQTLEKLMTPELLQEAVEEAKKAIRRMMLFSPEIESAYEIRFVD